MNSRHCSTCKILVCVCYSYAHVLLYCCVIVLLELQSSHCVYVCVQLSVNGYHDKLHILLQKIVDKMTTFRIDSQRFDILKEEVHYDDSI